MDDSPRDNFGLTRASAGDELGIASGVLDGARLRRGKPHREPAGASSDKGLNRVPVPGDAAIPERNKPIPPFLAIPDRGRSLSHTLAYPSQSAGA